VLKNLYIQNINLQNLIQFISDVLVFCSGLVLKLTSLYTLYFSKNMLYTKAYVSLFEEETLKHIIYRCLVFPL